MAHKARGDEDQAQQALARARGLLDRLAVGLSATGAVREAAEVVEGR